MTDTHIHAPQYPNTGIFGKTTLLSWLETYTFPLESSLSSLATARRIYTRVVRRTLSHGTTTAAYYATIHVPATNLLSDLCLSLGQRALVGRVCMTTDLSPEHYRDPSDAASLAATRACADHTRAIDPRGAIVRPIVTPRFAPSCSAAGMAALGALCREQGLFAQTHISENRGEVALVAERFPEAASYADVYDRAGLLGGRTILAHAVHLSEAERELVAARGCAVSHCPASNTALTSGRAPVRDLLRRGVKVGLGTDVSGGYSASVLQAVREAVWVSRHVAMGEEGEAAKLATEEALFLATRGGARCVGLGDKVGAFEVGMHWDAQMVGLREVPGEAEDEEGESELEGAGGLVSDGVDVWGWESWENRINKWVYNGDDRNTLKVWVKGRLVHSISAT